MLNVTPQSDKRCTVCDSRGMSRNSTDFGDRCLTPNEENKPHSYISKLIRVAWRKYVQSKWNWLIGGHEIYEAIGRTESLKDTKITFAPQNRKSLWMASVEMDIDDF